MEHSFNILIAKAYGINCAVVIKHLDFWLTKNKASGTNYYDGKYWTYFSASAFLKIFPYFTEKQYRYTMNKLEEDGIIFKGNYNKKRFDKTCWYTLTDDFCSQWTDYIQYQNIEAPEITDDIDIQVGAKNKKEAVKYAEDSREYAGAVFLFKLIKENNPKAKEPNYQAWAHDLNKIFVIDGKSKDEVKELMLWCQKDTFWRMNILSMATFRKQYEKLYTQMLLKNKTNAVKDEVTKTSEFKPDETTLNLLNGEKARRAAV